MTETDTFLRKQTSTSELPQYIEETYNKVEKLSTTKKEIPNSLVAKYFGRDMSGHIWSIATKGDDLGNIASKCFFAYVRSPKREMINYTNNSERNFHKKVYLEWCSTVSLELKCFFFDCFVVFPGINLSSLHKYRSQSC